MFLDFKQIEYDLFLNLLVTGAKWTHFVWPPHAFSWSPQVGVANWKHGSRQKKIGHPTIKNVPPPLDLTYSKRIIVVGTFYLFLTLKGANAANLFNKIINHTETI